MKDSVIIYVFDNKTIYKREILTDTPDPTDNRHAGFLMYRVELKQLYVVNATSFYKTVPNVPYGVETRYRGGRK